MSNNLINKDVKNGVPRQQSPNDIVANILFVIMIACSVIAIAIGYIPIDHGNVGWTLIKTKTVSTFEFVVIISIVFLAILKWDSLKARWYRIRKKNFHTR